MSITVSKQEDFIHSSMGSVAFRVLASCLGGVGGGMEWLYGVIAWLRGSPQLRHFTLFQDSSFIMKMES